ncbi:unnamed protein product, partial [Discosporangium mesarthrocarpum]
MGDEIAELIATTKSELDGLFQKPKLSEKLLSKPPFRFLHDIVSAVTTATGFADGLYSGAELDSGAIKDKGAKISYLDKLAALLGVCTGEALNLRPSKVVAGLEPECTNKMLAVLGKCAKSGTLDFSEAVTRTLAGEGPGERPPPLRSASSASSNNPRRGSAAGAGGVGDKEVVPDGRGTGMPPEGRAEAKGTPGA